MNVDTGHQAGAKIRRKRAWIFPGTLWCGHGSTAGNYEQLGMFEHVDRCCREHDHCAYMIRPFTVSFGVLNPSPFTISHCDCDHRFKQCLLSVNDTVSNMVGYTFFNILKLRCFDLIQKRRCTQLNWFGIPTTPKENPTVPQQETVSSNETTKSLSYSLQKEKNSAKETTGNSSICDAFRYLDRCKYRIGPMEKMYGHHNKESTTMYHCDCIHRFTANLKQLKKANTLQFLLGKFVSLSCIEISNIKECHKTTSCPVIISKTTKLDASLKKMEDAQATAKHIKQLANKRTPRQLHKYCHRILNPRNTKHGNKKLL
ncbi:hypothetical protein NFI96_014458 [Prochilodus magdalenae]|nr:hypothetical protein NFI96_014458 [Prochilodus magdalenae]